MKRFLLIFLCILLSATGSRAARPRFMAMLEEAVGTSYRRHMSTVVTTGFRPSSHVRLPEELFKHVFPKKVRFLDKERSFFVEPGDKQSFNASPPTVVQEDGHSIRVNLKKSRKPPR